VAAWEAFFGFKQQFHWKHIPIGADLLLPIAELLVVCLWHHKSFAWVLTHLLQQSIKVTDLVLMTSEDFLTLIFLEEAQNRLLVSDGFILLQEDVFLSFWCCKTFPPSWWLQWTFFLGVYLQFWNQQKLNKYGLIIQREDHQQQEGET
jgi:hypothetical protein